MPDSVPTAGLWQQDAELQRLLRAALAAGTAARGSQTPGQQQAWQLFNAYVTANRARLGIPDNYYPDPRTGGQTLYDPNQNQLRDAAITGGIMGAGGYGLGALLGGGSAAATGGSASVIPGTGIPTVAGTGVGVTAPPAVTAGTIAGTTAAGTSAIDRIRRSLTSPEGIASAAALIPALLANSGGNSSGGTSEELRRIQAITEARMRRADPLHQVAVQLAFDRAPTSARRGVGLPTVPLPS